MMKKIAGLLLSLLVIFGLVTGCKSQGNTTEGGVIRDIFAGSANVFILREDNTLWAAGYNRSGQFGQDLSGEPRITRLIDDSGQAITGVKSVAAGESHAVILKDDGTLWGAGDSSSGELGQNGGRLSVFTRLKAQDNPLAGIKTVAAGNNSTFFIDGENSLWAAGYNYYGELGLGNRDTSHPSFRQVEGAGQNVKALAAGLRHTVLLKEDGALWAAGYNYFGQLGLGDTEDRNSFTEVKSAGSDITAVAAGNYHTVILKSDGSVWATGSNFWGQLGFYGENAGNNFTQALDEKGSPLTGVKQIAARGSITVIQKADGSLLVAGDFASPEPAPVPDYSFSASGSKQETGTSSFVPLVPEQGAASKLGDVKKIVLGYNSIYVIDSDGRLWAAGSNRYGQLNLGPDTEASSTLKLIDF